MTSNVFDDGDKIETPRLSSPRQFVVFPQEEPLRLPKLGAQPPERGYRESLFAHHYNDPRPLRFADTGSPLWVEVHEVEVDQVVAQRDGSVALHFDDLPTVEVIPVQLVSFVRIFPTLDEATRHALAQNIALAALHERWRSGVEAFKLEAEALIGRLVVQKAPEDKSVVPQMADAGANPARSDTDRLDWLSGSSVRGSMERLDAVEERIRPGGMSVREAIDSLAAEWGP